MCESIKAMFSLQHTSDTTFSDTAWRVSEKYLSLCRCVCLLPLPISSLPNYLLLSPSPSPFYLHSSFQQCPVLPLVTTRWFGEALKSDSIVYVRAHNVVHTQVRHVEKYCPLHCPQTAPLILPHTHTHIKTLLCVPANSQQCIREYSQGHCSGLSEVETHSAD